MSTDRVSETENLDTSDSQEDFRGGWSPTQGVEERVQTWRLGRGLRLPEENSSLLPGPVKPNGGTRQDVHQ